MNRQQLLIRATKIAQEAHRGQWDRNGMPYILHPIRVMNAGKSWEEKMVGILHDVVEDSEYTIQDLANENFPEHILQAVDAMTKKENQSYQEYLDTLKKNALAVRVKLNDLTDNMDIRRLNDLRDEDVMRLRKYLKAYNELIDL